MYSSEMGALESRDVEWKGSWKDECLKTLCAFANTEGGTMTIGIDDDGNVVGVDNPEKLLKQLPYKIRSRLGISPFIRLDTAVPPHTITILIEKAPSTVYLDGRLYIRSGSTTQMIMGCEPEMHTLAHAGFSWTDMPVANVSISDLSPEAVLEFKNLGRAVGRLSTEESELGTEALLDKLDLIRDGLLTRAAVLLFHPRPGKVLGPVSIKIGMFEGPDLLYQDEFTGPLVIAANQVVSTLMTKYTVRPVVFRGIVRTEPSPYPEPAIREAVLNAIVHNEYSSHVPIQIKVSKEGLTIYNEGGIPAGWTVDKLMGQHKSLPRNPLLASAFYRAGFIESFGRGIGKIMSQFEGRSVQGPVFDSDEGFSITFVNEFSQGASVTNDKVDPQSLVLNCLAERGASTYLEISSATGLGIRQIQRIIRPLLADGTLTKEKRGREVLLSLG